MADEKEVKKEVETEKVDTEKKDVDNSKSTEEVVKKDEDKKEVVDESKEEESKKEESKEDEKTTEDVKAEEQPEQVQETEESGNGIRIEDVVTKEMLAERLAAFEAKLDAIVKENQDLKNQLSSKDDELNGMKDKYENKDFGNQ